MTMGLNRALPICVAICVTALIIIGCGKNPAGHVRDGVSTAVGSEELPRKANNKPTAPPASGRLNVDEYGIQSWESVPELPKQIAIVEHVFWEPDDTTSLRKLIANSNLVEDRQVLEIGTGSGLISLCCLQAGANQVVATDINPWAVKNALYNAEQLGLDDRLSVRLVSQKTPDAWSVIADQEKFDVIVSNPPWEPGKPVRVEDFAFYDPDWQLMQSLVKHLPQHLNPKGRVFLAYGCVTAIKELQKLTMLHGHTYTIHDDRKLDDLPDVFLPGMLLEIHVQ